MYLHYMNTYLNTVYSSLREHCKHATYCTLTPMALDTNEVFVVKIIGERRGEGSELM